MARTRKGKLSDSGAAETVTFLQEIKEYTLTEKEDGKGREREMIAQQRVSRRADLRATNEKFQCTFVFLACLSSMLRWRFLVWNISAKVVNCFSSRSKRENGLSSCDDKKNSNVLQTTSLLRREQSEWAKQRNTRLLNNTNAPNISLENGKDNAFFPQPYHYLLYKISFCYKQNLLLTNRK